MPMKNSFLAFSCVLALTLLVQQDGFSAEGLAPSAKAQYKDLATYLDVCRDPAKFAKKDDVKLKFKIVFKNKADKLPQKFEDAFSKNLEMIVPDVEIPEGFAKIPIVYSASKNKLGDDITNLELGKPVFVYATLRYKTWKDPKKNDIEKLYAFFIDDIETPEVSVKDSGAAELSAGGPSLATKSRRVDLQYEKFLDKNVSFVMHFKDTDNRLPADILKLTPLTNEKNFVVFPTETFHTALVASRDNEKCVEPLIEASTGDIMTVYGTLKKADDPSSQKNIPVYYFWITKLEIEPAPKPQPAAAPATAAPSAPAPAPAPALKASLFDSQIKPPVGQ